MPSRPWKSRWEIHREDLELFREELREDRARSEERWTELREETRDLWANYSSEIVKTRLFNRELMIRLEKTYANLGSTMELVGDELVAVREELHELKGAVDAQTEAILRLVDRFEDPDGRPPV